MLSAEESLGLAVAACREAFEETGVLPVVDSAGQPCPAATLSRLQTERTLVATQPEHLAILLEREQLWLDVERLVYWAHWITPSAVPRRFDTRFFAIAAGADQIVTADATETMECRWLTPASIIELADRDAMPIATPTRCNLIDLRENYGRHRSLDALLAAEARRAVPPVLPKVIKEESRTSVVMPWDADYASLAGEGVPAHIEYPACLRAQRSRVVTPIAAGAGSG
jgi:8-oxo-dGTP pyrophosphatase MutT (NUDIX family)